MQSGIVAALQAEERQLVAELRATLTFRKLDAIRRLIALYGGADGATTEPPLPTGTTHLPITTNGAAVAADGDPAVLSSENDDPGPRAVREGNKAVSVVRAALAAVTS